MTLTQAAIVAASTGTNPDDNRGAFLCLGAFAALILGGIMVGWLRNRGGGGRHR